jgi:hypothetical protein
MTCLDQVIQEKRKEVLLKLRQAIQDAEFYGLVRTENGLVILGALDSEYGFILVGDEFK